MRRRPTHRMKADMAREIVLDTETTGIDPRSGHRVIELACIEVEDLLPTGEHLHRYIDPERDIEPEAQKVHGIDRATLHGKPRFAHPDVVDAFLDFIGGARLVAHNAAFDAGFLNMELERAGRRPLPESRWTCTLKLAQKRFPGMHNSLDSLLKRYRIDASSRVKHGALIDTRLLALVYLELQGGKERGLDFVTAGGGLEGPSRIDYAPRPRPLAPRLRPEDIARHAAWVASDLKDKALWYATGALARPG